MNFTPTTLCIGFSSQEFNILQFEALFTDNCVNNDMMMMYPYLIKEVTKVIISSNNTQTFEQILTGVLCEMFRYCPDNIMQSNYVNWDNKMVHNFESISNENGLKLDEAILDRYRCGDQKYFVYAVAYRNGKV